MNWVELKTFRADNSGAPLLTTKLAAAVTLRVKRPTPALPQAHLGADRRLHKFASLASAATSSGLPLGCSASSIALMPLSSVCSADSTEVSVQSLVGGGME